MNTTQTAGIEVSPAIVKAIPQEGSNMEKIRDLLRNWLDETEQATQTAPRQEASQHEKDRRRC